MTEPEWVVWARRLAAIAQNGLEFSSDPYDRRYAEVQQIAGAMIAAGSGAAPEAILPLLAAGLGLHHTEDRGPRRVLRRAGRRAGAPRAGA